MPPENPTDGVQVLVFSFIECIGQNVCLFVIHAAAR